VFMWYFIICYFITYLQFTLKFTPIVCTHAVNWAVEGSINLQLFARPEL